MCVCVCVCACTLSRSVVSDSLWLHGLSPTRLLCPWDFFRQEYNRVVCHFLLQRIFLTQRLNPSLLCLLYCRQILYPLSHWGSHVLSACWLNHWILVTGSTPSPCSWWWGGGGAENTNPLILCLVPRWQPACILKPSRGFWPSGIYDLNSGPIEGGLQWVTKDTPIPSTSQEVLRVWIKDQIFLFSSVQFSCSVMSDSLWPHGLQHARLPCPSPTPGVDSNSCPLSRWCHSTISSSVVPFSCLQSFPASGSFQISQISLMMAHILTPYTVTSHSILMMLQ